MIQRSPLAPACFPDLPSIAGLRLTGRPIGLKRSGAPDLMLAILDPGSTIAGVTTQSLCPAAPVLWCRQALKGGYARAIIANSGNANASNGHYGEAEVNNTVKAAAKLWHCSPQEVFIASTGVIGERLPKGVIANALPSLATSLTPTDWENAAKAIMTTDSFAKGAQTHFNNGAGETVRLIGIAKGSGMIAPHMATMLAFIFTDATITPDTLHRLTCQAVMRSFNSITVDGDMSTNDMVLVAATGQANQHMIEADTPLANRFSHALEELMIELACQIIRDGEGARKFVTIDITGAQSELSARQVGLTIGSSLLVKTAIAAGDANWGRLIMAVGKAGEPIDYHRLSITIGKIKIISDGQINPHYDETLVTYHLAGQEISLSVDLGVGQGYARIWTCDLTEDYIKINASYRS